VSWISQRDRSTNIVVRRRRSLAKKRRIVELTLQPGASVALVGREHGVNANQVFKWRRNFERGELSKPVVASAGLLPVTVSAACEMEMRSSGVEETFRGPDGKYPINKRQSVGSNSRTSWRRVSLSNT
jgi:transposase-like protein